MVIAFCHVLQARAARCMTHTFLPGPQAPLLFYRCSRAAVSCWLLCTGAGLLFPGCSIGEYVIVRGAAQLVDSLDQVADGVVDQSLEKASFASVHRPWSGVAAVLRSAPGEPVTVSVGGFGVGVRR